MHGDFEGTDSICGSEGKFLPYGNYGDRRDFGDASPASPIFGAYTLSMFVHKMALKLQVYFLPERQYGDPQPDMLFEIQTTSIWMTQKVSP